DAEILNSRTPGTEFLSPITGTNTSLKTEFTSRLVALFAVGAQGTTSPNCSDLVAAPSATFKGPPGSSTTDPSIFRSASLVMNLKIPNGVPFTYPGRAFTYVFR